MVAPNGTWGVRGMASEAAKLREVPRDAGTPAPTVAIPPPSDAEGDDLLACLEFLTRFYQRPFSAAVLKAGLPLAGPRLTPSLFVRAASRAGLVARAAKRSLASLGTMDLPVVLLLGGDRACVVLERKETKGQPARVTVMHPDAGGGVLPLRIRLDGYFTLFQFLQLSGFGRKIPDFDHAAGL